MFASSFDTTSLSDSSYTEQKMNSKPFICISNVFCSFREIQAEIFSYDLDSYLTHTKLHQISSIYSNKKFIVLCSRMIAEAGSGVS